MKIGFTGTQVGMTPQQSAEVKRLLSLAHTISGEVFFHHGDCIGADAQAHDLATQLCYKIVIHPPKNKSKRAFKSGWLLHPEKEYLDRNHDIVDVVQVMIAAPKEEEEQLRSGTWATIRYASKKDVPLFIIGPSGKRIVYHGKNI